MAFKIERNDITKVQADAIVNTANPLPKIGAGTDSAVYNAAGAEQLIAARQKIGNIEQGQAASTPSFNLSKNKVKYIIHTVGCRWYDGKSGEIENLRNCYYNSLKLAKELNCKSIAIPLLATGSYGYPKPLALQTGIDEISKFLLENEMDITLVVYDPDSFRISEQLFTDIQSYIDDNYIDENEECYLSLKEETAASPDIYASRYFNSTEKCFDAAPTCSIPDLFAEADNIKSFQNTLQAEIASRGLANAEVYKRAHIDKKLFSKILCTKDYVPKKKNVIALGLALEFDLPAFTDFLQIAGFAFSPYEKFDIVIQYCIEHKIYNIMQIDTILFSYNLPLFNDVK